MMDNSKLLHDIDEERSKANGPKYNMSSGDINGMHITQIYNYLCATAVDKLKARISDLINNIANGNHFRAAMNNLPKNLAAHSIFGSNVVIDCIRDLYVSRDGTAAYIVFQLDKELTELKPVLDYVAVLKEDLSKERNYTWAEIIWLLVIADTLGKLIPEFSDSYTVAMKHRTGPGIGAGDIVDGKKWPNLLNGIQEQIKILIATY